MIYGYCRVSTKHQRITRQVTNIKELYPNAVIIKEFYTGTTQNRPHWDKFIKQLVPGEETSVCAQKTKQNRKIVGKEP